MTESADTKVPSCKGFASQDLLLIQHFLGLRVNQPLSLSKACQALPRTSIKDIVFLALDTENIGGGKTLASKFQVGISILDTRAVEDLLGLGPLVSLKEDNLFRTQNFCVGPSEYCSRAARRFLFGQSETVNPDQIKGKIKSLVVNRDVVLVVHDGSHEFWLLKELEIDLQPVAILDTQKAANDMFATYDMVQLQHSKSLKNLLIALDYPFNILHVAGNDANFTLRALLMIAAIAQSTGPDDWHEKWELLDEEEAAYVAERREIKVRQRERKMFKSAARKTKLAAEGHWSATKSGRQAFWAEKLKRESQ